MRIAILGTRGIPARYGGFETFAEKLAVGLSAHGYEVTVFCESDTTSGPGAYQEVKLRYVAVPRLGPLQTILYDVRCLWLARSGYDVVYMLGYGAAPFCTVPRLWGTEVWINPDGLEWARAKWGFWARSYFRLMEWMSLFAADRLIADAEAIAGSLSSRHGKLRACTVIPYGCDVIDAPPPGDQLSEWNLVPNDYYLVVCRLEPENHVIEILEAFQKSRTNKQLVLVANHMADTQYAARVRTVQDSRIQMIGTVYDAAKLACLRFYSFAYVHGHSVGGTNPSLLEAMGCGNLILAHDNPFNRETLGECGLFFADPLELSWLIDRAEYEEPDLELLKKACRSRAQTNYNWQSVISRYMALLNGAPAAEPIPAALD